MILFLKIKCIVIEGRSLIARCWGLGKNWLQSRKRTDYNYLMKFLEERNVLYIMMVITCLCIFIKTEQILHLKLVNVIRKLILKVKVNMAVDIIPQRQGLVQWADGLCWTSSRSPKGLQVSVNWDDAYSTLSFI